jgi:O-antigen ligase
LIAVATPVAEATPVTWSALAPWARGVLLVAVAWGAFAFGGVYPWAYWPLAAAVACVGITGLCTAWSDRRRSNAIALSGPFVAFGVAALLQVLPIPVAAIRSISPSAIEILNRVDLRMAAGLSSHVLSVDPAASLTALALFGAFALLIIGGARLLSGEGAQRLAGGISIIGVALALTGIIQQPLFIGKIYGFWTPLDGGNPFGPFVNKNHFAGWMLMALPVALGLLCARIARGMRGVKPRWRDRLLWLSSPDANRLILIASAAVVMALSLVLTMSRSGISALALAVSITGIVVLRRQGTRSRKTVALAYLAFLAVIVVAWVGADAIVTRFAQADWSEFNSRRGAWIDACNIATRFPWTGTGLNTYAIATLFYQQHDLAQHYSQAHNDYLQLAAEGGVLLVMPAVAALVFFVAAVRRRFREETSTTTYWLRVGAVTGLAAIALQETVEFSLQMPGNATLFAVLCAIALHRTPDRSGRVARGFQASAKT